MKKVFMIAHQFPPMGGSGVQRTSKFVKYLPKFGYAPIVFTIKTKQMLQDDSLNEDIGKDAKVIRTKAYSIEEKSGLLGIIGKIIGYKIVIPDPMWIWYRMNRKKALKYIKEEEIDLIYTSSYPYSGHLMGLYIKKKLPDIKWVADFRDEWTNNPYILDKNYNPIRKKIEKYLERKVALGCTRFIANTPLMLEAFLEDNDISDKADVISNGYDEADFEGINRDQPKNDKMIITYSGSIYGRTKPDAFFEALNKGIKDSTINKDKVKVRIIGNYTPKLVSKMKEICPYEDVIEFLPYMPHKKSIEKLLESDILLFIIGIGKGSEKIYTGKLFEYIYANRPMLAMVPEVSVAKDVIEETGTGVICSNEDAMDIYKELVKMYEDWGKDTLSHEPNWEEVSKYNRLTLTKKLVSVFKKAEGLEG